MGAIGKGSTVSFGGTSGTAMGTLTSITWSGSRKSVDITNMSSTNCEFIPGFGDSGEVSIEGVYDKTNFDKVVDILAAAANTVSIVLSDTATFTCQGFATGAGFSAPHDDKISYTTTFKLTGAHGFAAS